MRNQKAVAGRAGNLNDGIHLAIITNQADFHHAIGQHLRLDHFVPSFSWRRSEARRPIRGYFGRLCKIVEVSNAAILASRCRYLRRRRMCDKTAANAADAR
jgi:hypothetical protein